MERLFLPQGVLTLTYISQGNKYRLIAKPALRDRTEHAVFASKLPSNCSRHYGVTAFEVLSSVRAILDDKKKTETLRVLPRRRFPKIGTFLPPSSPSRLVQDELYFQETQMLCHFYLMQQTILFRLNVNRTPTVRSNLNM